MALSHIKHVPAFIGSWSWKSGGSSEGRCRTGAREASLLREATDRSCQDDNHGRSLGWRPGGRADNWGNPSRAHAESGNKWESLYRGKMGTILLVYAQDAHSKWGKFCMFSPGLPSDQWHESGRGQAWSSVLLPQAGCTSCSWPPDPNQHTGRVRADSATGKGVYEWLGCDKTKLIFSGLIKKVLICFTSYKTYFMFCYVNNIFLTIIKMSLSSGKLGGMPIVGISQWSTYVKNPRYVAISNQLCLGRALEYLGWKVESLWGREHLPNKPVWKGQR